VILLTGAGGKVAQMLRPHFAGSGHIAGVINPPAAHKYQYWTNDKLPPTVEEWQAGSTEYPGSWWPDWDQWLSKLSARKSRRANPATESSKSWAMRRATT
jgi:polyhydroxyalkanoate synthase